MQFAFRDVSYIQKELIEAEFMIADCFKLSQICIPLAFLHLSKPKTLGVFFRLHCYVRCLMVHLYVWCIKLPQGSRI